LIGQYVSEQWKGKQHMTTPNGTPSVSASPRDLNEQLQDGSLPSTQAHASGGGQYTGSGEPAPKVVGQYGTDVHGRYTEGDTVGNDQTELNPTAPQGAP
jgi:hypothetical protein